MSEAMDRLVSALADRYTIERALGAGGMATVYLAQDLKHERKVALKVLRPEMSDALGADRFLREIRTTAGLRHPNILPLYDSGEAAGLLYYVMPWVEGESLRDRLEREGSVPLDESLRLAAEVCDALVYAHGHGVIHRDIKPENILLEGGHALVADFGIALAVAAAGAERVTQTGVSVGTPLYMSPEQAAADPDLDGRSDLYSLACVLFEMIAGQPPFAGATPEAILVQRFTQPPPKLSAVRGTAPRRLEAALARAMARDPADRFAGVAAFAHALAEAPGRAAAAPEPSIAVLPFTNMSGDPEDDYFSDGVSDEITNVLSRLGGLRVAARTSAFAFKGTREDLRVVGEKLSVATVLEGSVRRAGNRMRVTVQLVDVADGYHLWSERYDRELTDIFAIQDEIAAAVADHLKVTLGAVGAGRGAAGTTNLEAYDLYLQGRAFQLQRGAAVVRARDLFEQAVSLDPDYVDALAMLADSSRIMGLYSLVRPHDTMPRAKAAAESALRLRPDHAEALATLADLSMYYDFDEASASAYWERALAADPWHVRARAEHAVWWMTIYHGLGEGIMEAARAVEADPLNSWAAGMHAVALAVGGRPADAEREATHALTLDPDSFFGHWVLQFTRFWTGDFEGSIAAAGPALVMSGRSPWVLGFLAEAYAAAGQQPRAAAAHAELEARATVEYVAATFRAAAASAAGDLDRAMDLLELAVEERDPFVLMAMRRPLWEPIRAHPRFQEIMAPTGLTSVRGAS
jgi:TolB-like protein/tRNA A-37 threonylcarbamoyl transferase component Bud32